MRRKILSSALAVLLSFTMVAPAFASVASWETGAGTTGESDSLQQAVSDAANAAFNDSSNSSTVYLNEDTTIDASESYIGVYVDGSNQTIDLQGNKLTIENGLVGVSVGSQTTGISITNGTIELNEVVAGVSVAGDGLALQDVTISASLIESDGVSGSVIFAEGDSKVTLNECVIDAENSELFMGIDSSTVAVESGSYTGNISEGSYETGENNAAKNEEFSSEGTLVVTNDNTAAVVKDEKGNVKTYSDLNKAVEKSGDQPVTVLKTDDVANLDIKADTTLNLVAGNGVEGLDKAIKDALATNNSNAAYVKGADGKYHTFSDLSKAMEASEGAAVVVTDESALGKLEVKEGDKLNLVDAKGNSLNEKVSLGVDLELKDGVVSKVERPIVGPIGPVDPGTWEPVGPVDPYEPIVRPVDPTVEIDDPDVPLASGPVTRAQFVDYLWRYDGQKNAAASTFADVAEDHEYADAIGWAQANGLILGDENNDFAPDELVTVSAVRTILTRYAKWKEMVMPELTTLTGADDAAVLNCDEVLAEFFGE